jgi:hypothetical protein
MWRSSLCDIALPCMAHSRAIVDRHVGGLCCVAIHLLKVASANAFGEVDEILSAIGVGQQKIFL